VQRAKGASYGLLSPEILCETAPHRPGELPPFCQESFFSEGTSFPGGSFFLQISVELRGKGRVQGLLCYK